MTEVRTYSSEFDEVAYTALRKLSAAERPSEKERLDLYTNKQLETLLAERFNVLTSTFYYDMNEGQLWGQDMNEPAIESFKRGRDYRKLHGNPIDRTREEAEIEGFAKIEQMLREEKDVLSISPKGEEGSTYQHNFYDIFRWKNGKIEVKRYSSALKIIEYQEKLGLSHQSPEEFLANPIDISSLRIEPEKLHAVLHKDHEFVSDEVFDSVILPSSRPYRMGYLKAMYEGNLPEAYLNINAAINISDERYDAWKKGKEGVLFISQEDYSREALLRRGNQEVRQTSTGCGMSGGFKFGSELPKGSTAWSVSEFGKKADACGTCNQSAEDDHYHCPGCGGSYESERSKPAGARTKVCNREVTGDLGGVCGFKFAC